MECYRAVVERVERWSEKEALLWCAAPEMAQSAKAGQFVMAAEMNSRTFLKKAISVHAVVDKCLGLAVQGVGPGTKALVALQEGDLIDLIGPLGKGFDTAIEGERIFFIAGGIGKAPFRLLTEKLLVKNNQIVFLVGGRDTEALAGLNWAEDIADIELRLATEDGSLGHCGYVTDLLTDLSTAARVYACGPLPMLKTVQQLVQKANIPCQLSLEGKMACGVGVCLGCTCQQADLSAPYFKVCKDGPVFWANEVVL